MWCTAKAGTLNYQRRNSHEQPKDPQNLKRRIDRRAVPDRAGSGPDPRAAAAFMGEVRPMKGKTLPKGQKAMLMT